MTSRSTGLSTSDGKFGTFFSRVGFWVLVVAILIAAVDEITVNNTPKIVVLSSSTSQVFLRPQKQYRQAATSLLRSSLANRTKLTINTDALSSKLRDEFPELAAVSIDLPLFGHSPTIYIQPSEPALILITKTNDSFILDGNGEALVAGNDHPAQVGQLNIPAVIDQSGLSVSVGQTVLPSTTVSFVKTVAAQLTVQHIAFSSMVLPQAAGELDVYLEGQPYYVKFNTEDSNSVLQQIGTFIAVMKNLQGRGIVPHNYIDVRVDGRAYYK